MHQSVTDGGRIDMTRIGTTSCHLFENYLIISLASNWIEVFGKIPEFDVVIDSDDKLRLTSTDCINRMERKY